MKDTMERLQPSLPSWRRACTLVGQIVFFVLVWQLAATLVRITGLSISEGVLGLFALLCLLLTGTLDVRWIKSGASWLLGELVLFFIPGVVAVIKYQDLLRKEGWQLLFAIAFGTILVMVCTAVAVHLGCRIEQRLFRRDA